MTKTIKTNNTTPSGDVAPRRAYQQTVDAVLAQTKSHASGLSAAEAAERLKTFGPNALPEKKGKPAWLRFLAHFNDVLIFVLLAAAALTAVMGHWVDTLVILGVTVINALIGHIQESNAEKSLQGIRNMLSSDARVQRGGKHETIPTRDLVPGDIVILRAGDRVPADMRLIESHNLRVEEAILTGESTVVDKTTDALEGELPLGDRTNMLFSGTTISAGGGVGVVTATGQETELGHINQMMAGIEKHRTPLLVQMDKLGKAIFVIILAMMAALFVFSLALRDIPLGELLLSLISLAVAAVPPLNGFAGEWVIYQSFFKLSTGDAFVGRLLGPLLAVGLAITGALAVMCMAKVYGVTFLGASRSKEAENATCAPGLMTFSVVLSAVCCVIGGVAAPWLLPLVSGAFPVQAEVSSVVSQPLIAILLIACPLLPLLLMIFFKGDRLPARSRGAAWVCGYDHEKSMVVTAHGFAMPVKEAFAPILKLRHWLNPVRLVPGWQNASAPALFRGVALVELAVLVVIVISRGA